MLNSNIICEFKEVVCVLESNVLVMPDGGGGGFSPIGSTFNHFTWNFKIIHVALCVNAFI